VKNAKKHNETYENILLYLNELEENYWRFLQFIINILYHHTRTMAKQKYNYEKLQLEFFKSEFDEVKAFITDKWLIYNSEWTKRTKGRAKEKKEYNAMIVEKALKKNAEKQIDELEIPIDYLKKWKKNFIIWIVNDSVKKADKMSMSDKVKGLNAIKTELMEPTSIWKTDATIKWEPIPEDLLIKN